MTKPRGFYIQVYWDQLTDPWPKDWYEVVEDHWDDGEEWAIIRIIKDELQIWITEHRPDWIL